MIPKKTLLASFCLLTYAIAQSSISYKTSEHLEQENINQYRTGDIISHTSKTNQSKIIKAITGSNYTHIGIIVKKKDKSFVLEAVQPVKYTPLEEWIDRGIDDKYTVARYPELTTSGITKIIAQAERFLGKDYDPFFHPSDKQIYCSELIQKAYERGIGLELGKWESFDSIAGNKQHIPEFEKEIKRRWGKSPGKTKMVTPESIMNSNHLTTIYSNY